MKRTRRGFLVEAVGEDEREGTEMVGVTVAALAGRVVGVRRVSAAIAGEAIRPIRSSPRVNRPFRGVLID
jgi:ABC-type uncharacterized transport system permease subunit